MAKLDLEKFKTTKPSSTNFNNLKAALLEELDRRSDDGSV